ncbi:LamG-like jellyroll fold domain-containing protein [Rhodohalobacter barkolensis]|nr:LamG-like jellyroll fold domain-containing protein [Rhodohalobacter barkolensis]
MGNVSTFSRVFLLVAVSIMLMVSCGDEGPINVNEEPEIVIQKKEAALEKAEQILPSDLLNSLEDEIDSQSSNIKEAFLDTLSSSLEQLVDTLSKYHSTADLKNEIERIDREAQKFISSEFGDTKAKAFNHLGLGYGKGVSIETGIEANVASGIATGLSAQGGGGSEVLYDFVNMDREVYIFTACGIGVNLAGVGIGTSLSANVGLSGYKKWLLNLIQDKRNNKFQGPAKASSFGIGASGFLGAVGLDASVSIGKSQDVEGDASFYNLIECPSYFNASPTPNGVKEIFFEVSVGTGAGVGGELIAALQAGQIGSNRSAINGSYSSYENKYSSRKISSYKMSAELLTSSPFLGVTTGLPGVNDLTAAALAIHYGGIDPSEFDQAKPALSFSPEVFHLPSAEDSYQLEISNIGTGEIEWEIVQPGVEWMIVTPTSGTGRTLVDIIVDENTTGDERTAELYINSNGGNSEPILITQEKRPLTNGLVASYPFNGNANDETGNGFEGTVYGASLTEDRFGNINSAYGFNGTNSHIDLPSSVLNEEAGTISIWFNVSNEFGTSYNSGHIFSSANFTSPDGTRLYLWVKADNSFGSSFISEIMGEVPINREAWHHAVLTWDDNMANLYLNGTKVESISGGRPAAERVTIGSYGHGFNAFFEGKIDDAKIYNIALSEDQVLSLYQENGWTGHTGDWPKDTTTEIVDVYNPATGQTWMDRNLGASRAATSMDDEEAYGDLYQWGRAADGHEKRDSDTTYTLSNTYTPGHGNFILNFDNKPDDWHSPQNDNLWHGVDGINNPCPNGYRLPTEAEWEAERQSWSSNNRVGAFASQLKLPVAGHRNRASGSLDAVGSNGRYWSSTVFGSLSRYLIFFDDAADMLNNYRAVGYSVRCIKD